MKKLSLFMLLAVLAFTFTTHHASAADDPEGWTTDFDAALKEAKANNKQLFIKFTGSDWCPPCQHMWKNIFSKAEFRESASKDYVLVYLDFPRGKQLPAALTEQNTTLQAKYDVRSYPTVVIADSEGTEVYRKSGAEAEPVVETYLADLKSGIKTNAKFVELKKLIAAAEGVEKVKLIDQYVDTYPNYDIEEMAVYADQIIELDPEDKSGVVAKYKNFKDILELGESFQNMPLKEQMTTLDKMISEKEMPRPFKQVLVMLTGQMLAQQGDFDGALIKLEEAGKVFPESEFALKMLPQIQEQVKAMSEAMGDQG